MVLLTRSSSVISKTIRRKKLVHDVSRRAHTDHNKTISEAKPSGLSQYQYLPHPSVQNLKIKESDETQTRFEKQVDDRLPNDDVKLNNKIHPRINDFGIQMINNDLFNTLFKQSTRNSDRIKILDCIKELRSNSLFISDTKVVPDVQIKLPQLQGESIEEHFYNIGNKLSSPYKQLLLQLIEGIPEVPQFWNLEAGWTRYSKDGVSKVHYPLEDAFVLDIEVCCQGGAVPTIATAVSREAWYAWVSTDLVNRTTVKKTHPTTDDLIPLESNSKAKGFDLAQSLVKPRIAVGHNVSYDRSKIKEQYWLDQTGMRFLDTMSLHICISGITSYQKALLKAGVGEEEWTKLTALNSLSNVHNLYCGGELSKDTRDLFVSGSIKDISDNFQEAMSYCAHDVLATFNVLQKIFPLFLERFSHPVTLAGMLEIQTAYLPVNKNWTKYISDSHNVYEDLDMEAKSLMTQCANDVCELMHEEHYKSDLWMWDQDWTSKRIKLKKVAPPKVKRKSKIIKKNDDPEVAEKTNFSESSENNVVSTDLLKTNDLQDCPEESEDIALGVLNSLLAKYSSIVSNEKLLPSRILHMPGYPEWYRKLCSKPDSLDWSPEPNLIGTGLKITPKLLHLTWDSLPVHHEKGEGWGYLVPYKTNIKIQKEESLPIEKLTKYFLKLSREQLCSCPYSRNSSNDDCKLRSLRNSSKICKADLGFTCGLIRLPHKDGPTFNVGNPLAKDFINKFSENALSSDSIWAKRIIEINRMLSYWRNSRERIESQFVCWLKPSDLSPSLQIESDIGAILPLVVVCGTLTRRAVEPTWMTASNSSSERIGSELRSMVQAPPGYSLVGADVDSQELWIASLLGDAYAAGLHGATPLGWMTLNGQKSDGTDMHSVTAKAVGISRNHAKILNYARIYGAGEKFSQRLLKQFNEKMSVSETIEKAAKMMELTKGKKVFKLKENVLPSQTERMYNRNQALELCTVYNKEVDVLFDKPQWMGGTESAMFNCLEMIANKPAPETPFLNCKLSRALEPHIDKHEKHLPTRINWVVQSGAVDFLHLMLVSMRWFLGKQPRFCLSFHDEVRYLIPDDKKYEAALALHVTNLLTRAFCVSRLGMNDLPMSVAFFSSVEVDKVLRKESKDDNKTPSNPFGLSRGYGIPLGESLDIYQAIEKAKGKIGIANV